VADRFSVNPDGYSLEQELVDQSGTHNPGGGGRHVPEVVVIDVEEELWLG
jgi:hypothetical protein